MGTIRNKRYRFGIVNWLIKPFTMYGIVYLFLFVIFGNFIASKFLFVVIPLAGGVLTRIGMVKNKGTEYFENTFVHKFDNATTIGLLLTLVLIFASQTEVILSNPVHIVLIAVPLIIQT